jgi:hypothetical protein
MINQIRGTGYGLAPILNMWRLQTKKGFQSTPTTSARKKARSEEDEVCASAKLATIYISSIVSEILRSVSKERLWGDVRDIKVASQL